VRVHIPREEERMHERPRIGTRPMMEACGKEKEKCELEWERNR
jgi:hypothetical protein